MEAIITLSRLVDQSPEIAKLIKAASVNIAEDVIDNTFKNPDSDEYLDSNWPLEYLAKDTLRGLENKFGEEKIESMESLKDARIKALEEQHSNSHTGGSIGFAFKKPSKKTRRKKRKIQSKTKKLI